MLRRLPKKRLIGSFRYLMISLLPIATRFLKTNREKKQAENPLKMRILNFFL